MKWIARLNLIFLFGFSLIWPCYVEAKSGDFSSSTDFRDALLNELRSLKEQDINQSDINQKLLTYLKDRIEVSASGISLNGNSVWARFKDGQEFVIYTR